MSHVVNEAPSGVHLTCKIPAETLARLDRLAEIAGLTRSQFLRLVLDRVDESAVPSGLAAHAAELRTARSSR